MTARQQHWARAAAQSHDDAAVAMFTLLALPNSHEREHNCREHSVGFRRDGRRGFKCGVDGKVIRWVDPR